MGKMRKQLEKNEAQIERLDISDVDLELEDFATAEGDIPLKPNERIVKQWTFTN